MIYHGRPSLTRGRVFRIGDTVCHRSGVYYCSYWYNIQYCLYITSYVHCQRDAPYLFVYMPPCATAGICETFFQVKRDPITRFASAMVIVRNWPTEEGNSTDRSTQQGHLINADRLQRSPYWPRSTDRAAPESIPSCRKASVQRPCACNSSRQDLGL